MIDITNGVSLNEPNSLHRGVEWVKPGLYLGPTVFFFFFFQKGGDFFPQRLKAIVELISENRWRVQRFAASGTATQVQRNAKVEMNPTLAFSARDFFSQK